MTASVDDEHPRTTDHDADAPPWRRVETVLMLTAQRIRQAFDDDLAALDLNLTSASLLAYVAEAGPITQTALAERLGIGRAATGTAIDKLEGRGLVERRPDPGDRRVWQITITVAGKECAERIADIDGELRRRLRQGISREERQDLADLLARIQHNLRT